MKKNGFISMGLIYTFFLIFLTFLTFMITNYKNNNHLLDEYKIRIKESFINTKIEKNSKVDFKLYTINELGTDKKEVQNIPSNNYILLDYSCDKGKITFNENSKLFNIYTTDKASCILTYQVFNNISIEFFNNNLKTLNYPNKDFTYECVNKNVNTMITYYNNAFNIVTDEYNECKVYFNDEVEYEKQ